LNGERLSTLVPFEALKLAAGVVLLSANIPLLFMGEEYGEESPFQYFISHTDPALTEAVKKGRKEGLAALDFQGDLPDPQAEETFLRSKIHLDLRQHEKHKILLELYGTLIKLRKEIPSLSHLSNTELEVETWEESPLLVMRRGYGEDRICSIFNFLEKPAEGEIFMRKGVWQKVFDSSSEEWGGQGSLLPGFIPSHESEVRLGLQGYSFVLYRKVTGKESQLDS
jgi:maltooligosyltrehalose trehalohydrolase